MPRCFSCHAGDAPTFEAVKQELSPGQQVGVDGLFELFVLMHQFRQTFRPTRQACVVAWLADKPLSETLPSAAHAPIDAEFDVRKGTYSKWLGTWRYLARVANQVESRFEHGSLSHPLLLTYLYLERSSQGSPSSSDIVRPKPSSAHRTTAIALPFHAKRPRFSLICTAVADNSVAAATTRYLRWCFLLKSSFLCGLRWPWPRQPRQRGVGMLRARFAGRIAWTGITLDNNTVILQVDRSFGCVLGQGTVGGKSR